MIGPWVGLRLWVLDTLTSKAFYAKMNPADLKLDPDPSGASGGILGIRWQAVARSRVYNVELEIDRSGLWYPLPVGVSNVVVYVNGLRYSPGNDYMIQGDTIIPNCTPGSPDCRWPDPAQTVVSVDHDR